MSNLLNKVYKKNSNFPWQTIGDETIIIDPKAKNSFELNEVGSEIWQKIDGISTLNEIKNTICRDYDVGESEVSDDLLKITSDLLNESLIVEKL